MVVVILLKSPCVFTSIIHDKASSGARPALLMGVAPEAIVEKIYFEYRLKDIVPSFISLDHNLTQ
jgi:hypothetical protein